MKNKLLITAIISTALVLCSCGKNNEESVSTTVAETTIVQETTQTPPTTTKAPETTTQAPTTTKVPETTTQLPETTAETTTIQETTEIPTTKAPETTTETTTAAKDSALFEDIYAKYVDPEQNERRAKVFSIVKNFVEGSSYETEIVESKSIKVLDDNGNYVYFGFKTLDGLDVINLITYYQASSNSEVSQKEYTGTELFKYEILTTHVIGEEEKEVDNIKQQKAFLFN